MIIFGSSLNVIRESQIKGTAFTLSALNTDGAAVDVHNLSDHGETQTCTEDIPGASGTIRSVKTFKNVRLVFRGYPDSVIGNRENHFFVFVLEPDKDISTFFSIFAGVVDEILQGTFQQKPVPADPHAGLYYCS